MNKIRFIFEACILLGLSLGIVYVLGQQQAPQPSVEQHSRQAVVKDTPDDSKLAGELRVNKKELTQSGFTLVPFSGNAQVWLLNMQGQKVHQWNFDASRARMLPNCNLLVVHGTKWGAKVDPWKKIRRKVREYDWDGNVVWEYTAPATAHHDIQRLPSGNTLLLHRVLVPQSYKSSIIDPFRRNAPLRSDAIIEIEPDGKKVWDWYVHEHVDLNSCGRQSCEENNKTARPGKARIDWTHINTISVIPDNKWYKRGEKAFAPGNIVTIPRNWWTVFIVDRHSKKIVWRYHGDYKGGLVRGHDAHIIPEGFPGAGNMLIFDNGLEGKREFSLVLEIDPVTKQVVWVYDQGPKFFSHSAGSVQRLSNGNTLIAEDVPGRILEVNQAKETVWEYKATHRTARPHRYAYDYCPKFEGLMK